MEMKNKVLGAEPLDKMMPATTKVAFFGMIASAGIIVVRYGGAVLENYALAPSYVPFTIVIGAFATALPLAAAYLVRRGWKGAPVMVTILGFWGTSALASYGDVLAYVATAISIATIIAIWTPSARSYSRKMREEQLAEM
jgi:hypothetical protein